MSGPRSDISLEAFEYTEEYEVTDEMKAVFNRDGGFVVKGLLNKDEVDHINKALTGNDTFMKHGFELSDGEGRNSMLVLWNHPGNDVTGMVARCEKIVNTCEKLLDGEIYHYHTKLMMKNAHTGGKHIWHQDYGYWYQNGNLKPDMMTVFVAIDPCVIENGCLQVLRGSHKYGRIDHKLIGGQQQADPVRVDALKKRCDWVYSQLQPGDALFFHSNLLHTSDKNDSDLRRWAFLCAYNKADNDPIFKHHSPNYTPLHKVPNSAIKDCTNFTDLSGKDFMDPATDKTIKASLKQTGFH